MLLHDADDADTARFLEEERHDHDLARGELARELGEGDVGTVRPERGDARARHVQILDWGT